MTLAILPAEIPAEAHIVLTPMQEQQIGWGEIYHAPIAYQRTTPALALLQETLMQANPGKLPLYTDDNHRGLRYPHLMITNRTRVNAREIPGGHVFISDALIAAFLSYGFDPQTGRTSGMQKERDFGNMYEFYGHSAIATAIAHEDAHWMRHFLQRETDLMTSLITRQQENDLRVKILAGDGSGFNSLFNALGYSDKLFPKVSEFIYKEEYEADREAMELLDNTDSLSPGSLFTVVARLREADPAQAKKEKETVHPPASVRRQVAIDHIRKISHGRVELMQDGRMKLDGKLFMGSGYLPKRDDVSAFDRTVFVAGELAKCVKYGATRFDVIDDDYSYKQSGRMYPIKAVNDSTRKHIFIDKLDVSQRDAAALKNGDPSGHAAEMKVAKAIKKFLESKAGRARSIGQG